MSSLKPGICTSDFGMNTQVASKILGACYASEPVCIESVHGVVAMKLTPGHTGWQGKNGSLTMNHVYEQGSYPSPTFTASADFQPIGSGSLPFGGCPPYPGLVGEFSMEDESYCPERPYLTIDLGDGIPEGTEFPPPVANPCTPDPNRCCTPPGGGPGLGGGCGGGGGNCEGDVCRVPLYSKCPIRYATGEIALYATDLATGGFGLPWGHTRVYSSRLAASETVGHGFNWIVQEWPYLVLLPFRTMGNEVQTAVVMGDAGGAHWFDRQVDGSYVPRFNTKQTLTLDQSVFRLTDLDGTVTEFRSSNGGFLRKITPGGEILEVKSTVNGYNPGEVERSYTAGGQTVTEQFDYQYLDTGDKLLQSVTLRRKVDSGAWTNVRRAVYTYYGYGEMYGMEEDLKTATTQTWNGGSWDDTGTSYYRYYLDGDTSSSSSSSSSSTADEIRPAVHALKSVLGPDAYARLLADPNVSDPLTATDAQIALYADHYFEYDEQQRVTKEVTHGGSRTFLFAYEESPHPDGYNSWKTKTTETLPDGSRNVVYSNFAGQTMLHVFQADAPNLGWSELSVNDWNALTVDDWNALEAGETSEWCEYYRYNDDARVILHARASAVRGYDEQSPDLLHEVNGNWEYLQDDEGLIETFEYHAPTGYLAAHKIQNGELGTPIKVMEREFVACHEGTSSSSSSSSGAGAADVWFISKEIRYPSDTDPSKKITTSYAYTWHPGTCQVREKVTTLLAVSTNQNGSGTSATRREYFDEYGNRTWSMDERGFITRFEYDIPTGALLQRIDDVDTAIATDAPSGWSTPTGGGLHLVTDYEHDDRGRITQILGPEHTIDLNGTATTIRRAMWTVYVENDDTDEVRIGQGYATGTAPNYTYTLINPVHITKTDKNGQVLDSIRATRASTAGKLVAGDTFPQSSYVRWTTHQYTDCCFLASSRVYHTIPTSGEGQSSAHYDQTEFGYDTMKRRNRHVTPGGTITYNVFDARGLLTATYIGTDDTGSTESDPTGGGAMGNNMVLVTANEYDNGISGRNGNRTRETQHVDATTVRVTEFTYDWRNRLTDTDGEVDFYAKQYYDNLDRVIKVERYDTTASGNLIARSETQYDDRGRVFRTVHYGVDPATGTVGNSLVDNTWYDAAGNVIQRQPARLMDGIELEYDSLGRLVKQTDPLDAETVFTWDAASNRTALTDAESNTTTWDHDGIGRAVKETNPLGDIRTFAYDNAGMLSMRTDRLERVIEFDYDDAGRLIEERWKEGNITANTIQMTYNPDGQVAMIGDDHSSYAYEYDLNGGMTEVDNDGTPGVPRVILSAVYNRVSEQTTLGATVDSTNDFLNSYGYDALGRTAWIKQDSQGGNSVAQKRVDFAYEVRGGYSTIDRYSDLTASSLVAKTKFGYDDFGRISSIDHGKGTTSLATHDYSFNMARLIDQHTTVDGDSDYSYDNAQLTEALHSFQANETYSYDLTGNRTNTGYSTGDANRLLSDGTYNYEYDPEGNRTKRTTIATSETVECVWDHRNRLTKVMFKDASGEKIKEIEYVYDVHNLRIGKLLDSDGDGAVDDQWQFVYDATKGNLADIVLVFDGSGDLRRRYLHGPDTDQPLADEASSGNVLWQLADHLGTVRDLAEYDAPGDSTSVANHLKYDAFGRITGQSNASLTPLYSFTGRDWDSDADLFYYRARWYDPAIGRFLSEDPLGFNADDKNLYRYVTNSPVMLVDPSGTASVEKGICRITQRLANGRCNFTCYCRRGAVVPLGANTRFNRPCEHRPSLYCVRLTAWDAAFLVCIGVLAFADSPAPGPADAAAAGLIIWRLGYAGRVLLGLVRPVF